MHPRRNQPNAALAPVSPPWGAGDDNGGAAGKWLANGQLHVFQTEMPRNQGFCGS